jgi:hypothetical protein
MSLTQVHLSSAARSHCPSTAHSPHPRATDGCASDGRAARAKRSVPHMQHASASAAMPSGSARVHGAQMVPSSLQATTRARGSPDATHLQRALSDGSLEAYVEHMPLAQACSLIGALQLQLASSLSEWLAAAEHTGPSLPTAALTASSHAHCLAALHRSVASRDPNQLQAVTTQAASSCEPCMLQEAPRRVVHRGSGCRQRWPWAHRPRVLPIWLQALTARCSTCWQQHAP